jgi:hypothetical protein
MRAIGTDLLLAQVFPACRSKVTVVNALFIDLVVVEPLVVVQVHKCREWKEAGAQVQRVERGRCTSAESGKRRVSMIID